MPFTCPECSTARSLKITHRLELPGDSRSDEIALQIVHCARCGFSGVAVYEESRRGALDDESFDHTGYRLPAKDLQALKKTMAQCPTPKNRRCRCPAHRALGSRDASGRWNGLKDVPLEGTFRLRF